jgi:hypothetical protein
MACGRLSLDGKFEQRLRVDRTFSFHHSFSLIHYWGWRLGNNWLHKNGLEGKRSVRSRNIPESGFVNWALLNGERASELLV